MEYTQIYKCLCDPTRLRILNLLQHGPLCVCHIQQVLDEPQAKVSKQLGYMKRQGLLVSERRMNWTVYSIAQPANPLLEQNLSCLQDLAFEQGVYRDDCQRLKRVDTTIACGTANASLRP